MERIDEMRKECAEEYELSSIKDSRMDQMRAELLALRQSHERMRKALEKFPIERFAWCNDSEMHDAFCSCGNRELRAALAGEKQCGD